MTTATDITGDPFASPLDSFFDMGRASESAPSDTAVRNLAVLADGLAAMLLVAQGLARAHRPVDLDGLDGDVGLLCARALDLPHEQGRMVRPLLTSLIGELDALAALLGAPPIAGAPEPEPARAQTTETHS